MTGGTTPAPRPWTARELPLARERLVEFFTASKSRAQGLMTRPRWSREDYWLHDEASGDFFDAAEFYGREALSAQVAVLWWVRPEMSALAEKAAWTLGRWIPADYAPANDGIVVFEDAHWMFPWADMPEWLLDQRPYGPLVPPCVPLDGLWWTIRGSYMWVRVLSRMGGYRLSSAAEVPHSVTWLRAPLKVTSGFNLPAHHLYQPRHFDDSAKPDVISFLGAAWALAGQTELTETTELSQIEKAEDVKLKPHKRRPPRPHHHDVTLVSLRKRPAAAGSGAAGKPRIEHDHCWMVGAETGGFWRNQVHGKDRALRKKIWVANYVAGPKDKPLKIPEKVHVLRK